MKAAVLIVLALAARTAFGDVTVDTTIDEDVDDGACSLREAIVAVNTNASYHGCVRSAATVDTIDFDLGPGTPSIAVSGSELPRFGEPVIVDGATGGATRVEIAGGGSFSTGLSFLLASNATGSEIRNLVINGFTSRQLLMSNGSNMVIEGNFLGTNAAGTAFVAGSGGGIEICATFSCGVSDGHQIGGPAPGQRNVIVANGTAITVPPSSATKIQGNFINTNAAGTELLSPGFTTGIVVSNAFAIVIGGANPGEGNVITGFQAIILGGNPAHAQTNGTVVQGNFIGTDVTGSLDIGGGGNGVSVAHAVNTQIGGLAPGEGNLISGWVEGVTGGSSGVNGTTVDDTTVQGNRIGTDAAGTGAISNSSSGVHLGDDAVIEGNVIAFNGGDGIELGCGDCVQRISNNAIHSNAGIGIDLSWVNGVTPNDADDADTGPNGHQNFPILAAVPFPGGTSISGTLDSTASTTFRVEIFANDACDGSGNGEGAELVGFKNDVTTDAGGDAAFTVTLLETVPAGKAMTATAIAPDGSTSEFSPCTPAPPPTTTTTTSTTTTSSSTSSTTSSSSSTTAAPSTTTTSSSSTSTSTTAAVATTSTSTSLVPTTTTVPGGCDGVPDGPTFVSIDCRLEALLARLAAESSLENFGPKLVHNVEKARARNLDAEDLCRTANVKKTKKRLQQAATALTQYAHRLNGLPARKRLSSTLRQSLVDEGAPIQRDLRTLRGAVRCPDDAAG